MTRFRFHRAGGLCLAAALAGWTLRAPAAPSFRSDKNYPNLGLRIRVLGNSAPEPLAQYQTYTYTFTRGAETFTRDLFDPRELWYATQHAGQWRDEAGNVLLLGHPTHLLPAIPSETKHVSREAFDAAIAEPSNAFDPASAEALAAWVRDFAECAPKAPEPVKLQAFNLATALFFPVEEPATLIYAFRVKARRPSGQSVPSDWFCAVIKIADGTPKSKVRKDFETQFLANVAAVPQTGATAAAGVQPKALTPAPALGGKEAAAIPDHPSRSAARKSIENMKDWWFAETPEYIFLSDIRSAPGRALVKELQATLPVLRGAFAKLVPPFESAADVSVVRIYEDREAYKQYVGKNFEWSAGVWSPMRRELVIQSQGKDREQTLSIIRHEGFHQYLFYACSMIENAAWFNEGHACFVEAAQVDGRGRVELPENERVEHLLRNLESAARQLPKLIHVGYGGFYNSGTDEQRLLNYTAAWALVYYLRKGAPSENKTAYAAIIGTYLKTLAATRDAEAATAAAFEGVDMARFQEDFTGFWKKGRSSAKRYDPFAEKREHVQR